VVPVADCACNYARLSSRTDDRLMHQSAPEKFTLASSIRWPFAMRNASRYVKSIGSDERRKMLSSREIRTGREDWISNRQSRLDRIASRGGNDSLTFFLRRDKICNNASPFRAGALRAFFPGARGGTREESLSAP